MTTTIKRWLDIPAARANSSGPLGAGLVQLIGSNATHAARQNNLRCLWEHPGSSNIYADVPPGGLDYFDWDDVESDGRFTAYAGLHRVRLFGETTRWPRLELRFRGLAPSGYELGVILVAMPAPGLPTTRGQYATMTTSATSLTDCALTLALDGSGMGTQRVAPRAGTGVLTTLDEVGAVPAVAVYLGAWCTSGGSQREAEMHGLTLFLREPT